MSCEGVVEFTIVDSKFSQSSPVISGSVHSKNERIWGHDSSFTFGSKFSNSANSRSSLRIRFGFEECSDSLPGFSGVGNLIFFVFRAFDLHQCVDVREHVVMICQKVQCSYVTWTD